MLYVYVIILVGMILFVLYGTLDLVDLLIFFCWDYLNLYVIMCVIYMLRYF